MANTEKNKERIAWLDIYKALAIICMILGHTNSFWATYVYLFHMSAFFFIAGCTSKLSDSFGDFILKKFKALIVPFLLVNFFYLLFHYLCQIFEAEIFWRNSATMNFLQHLNPLLNLSSTENIGGATWFLVALFFSHLAFQKIIQFSDKIKHKDSFWLIFIPVSAFSSWLLSIYEIKLSFMLDILPIALAFMGLGYYSHNNQLVQRIIKHTFFKYSALLTIPVIWYLGSFAYIRVDYAGRIFDNPLLILLYGIIGITGLISLSKAIEVFEGIAKVFSMLGRQSLWIMCFHFVAFKITYWLLYALGLVPDAQIYELIPLKSHNSYWWLFTITGLFFSLLFKPAFDLLNYSVNVKINKELYSKCFLTISIFFLFFICGMLNYTWIFSSKHFYALDDFSHLLAWDNKIYKDFFTLLPAQMYNDRPVGQIFIKLMHDLFTYNYRLQHLLIFSVYIFNGLLFYCLLLTIQKKTFQLCRRCLLISLIFLSWPKLNIPAEWISAIFDLLGLTISLLYLLLHFSQWAEVRKKASLLLRIVILILMARTKESTLMIPLAAAAFDYFNHFLSEKKGRSALIIVFSRNILPVSISIFYVAYLKYLQIQNPMGFMGADHPYLSSLSPIILFKNIFKYLYLFFNLNDWGSAYSAYRLDGLIILSIAVGLFGLLSLFTIKDRTRYSGLFTLSLFILALLPVLPLVNMQHKLYLYIPSIFIFIGLLLQLENLINSHLVSENKVLASLIFAMFLLFLNNNFSETRRQQINWSLAKGAEQLKVFETLQKIEIPADAKNILISNTPDYNIFMNGSGDVLRLLSKRRDLKVIILPAGKIPDSYRQSTEYWILNYKKLLAGKTGIKKIAAD